jgi:hypothetical protein
MIRSVTYRHAINAFLFTGLWFVLGAIVLWSPIPGALGIGRAMFGAWLLLFFAALAVSGFILTFSALNGAFPRRPAYVRRNTALPSPEQGPLALPRRSGDPAWAPRGEGRPARREG